MAASLYCHPAVERELELATQDTVDGQPNTSVPADELALRRAVIAAVMGHPDADSVVAGFWAATVEAYDIQAAFPSARGIEVVATDRDDASELQVWAYRWADLATEFAIHRTHARAAAAWPTPHSSGSLPEPEPHREDTAMPTTTH